jgi:hypothetical protein
MARSTINPDPTCVQLFRSLLKINGGVAVTGNCYD